MEETKSDFEYYEKNLEISVNTAKEIITDIIDTILVDLQTFYKDND